MWRRFAFLAATIINLYSKRKVDPDRLIKFQDKEMEIDMEKRKQEALETLRYHKSKFWTAIKDEAVKEVTGGEK